MSEENTDFLQSFYWESLPLRGARCRVDTIFQRVVRDLSGPSELRQLLGEILVGLALISSTQKHFERLILQAQSQGSLQLLVAEMMASGGMRAYARWRGEEESLDLAALPEALLALTADMGMDRDRYQGLIQLRNTLTQSLEAYFAESVQSPAWFRLVVDSEQGLAGGYFLQRLPGILTPEEWETATSFLAVGSDRSLLLARPEQFLPEIFPSVGVRLRDPEALHFQCSCSRERVERMLVALGELEVEETLAAEGQVEVTCEYCQKVYRLDAAAVAALFASGKALH
ncbi:Hsp33 family molecular chaperone HslO [Acidithiobacillus sp. IBUN Pt1247-S3]|uniref:Hsp33 family molecular chaperone HslO n=1 Tax=Acidithiobacillus sp. IBUN Pt1247-S3 TaxID=3166642 RepID=UPI0034E44ECC